MSQKNWANGQRESRRCHYRLTHTFTNCWPICSHATLASMGISCCCVYVSVHPSVHHKSASTETARFLMPNISAKLKWGHPQRRRQMQVGEVKCRYGSWKLATFDVKRWQLILVASLSHWASILFVCSTFTMIQSSSAPYGFVSNRWYLSKFFHCDTLQ